jgi:Domain of Unknown Function (DUF930)
MSLTHSEVEIAAQLIGFSWRYGPARDRDALAVAALLATLLHLALLKGLAVYSQAPAASAPSPETVIALVSASEIDSGKTPAPKNSAAPLAPETLPEIQARLPPAHDEPREERGEVWAQSRSILSSQELADPRNRKTAEVLKRLEPQTRLQQLCNLEAILQINRQYEDYAVDFVIAYAREAVVRKGDAIIARGAAFHSNGRWYNLAFECQLSANQREVAHLKFMLGDTIPGDQWADLNLPKAPANPLGGD